MQDIQQEVLEQGKEKVRENIVNMLEEHVEEIADSLTDEIWELIEGGIELQRENIELKKELEKYKSERI